MSCTAAGPLATMEGKDSAIHLAAEYRCPLIGGSGGQNWPQLGVLGSPLNRSAIHCIPRSPSTNNASACGVFPVNESSLF